jgi:dGTPase
MIDVLASDLYDTSAAAVAAAAPADIDAVRAQAGPLIGFSEPFVQAQRTLKGFLHRHLYTHPRVGEMTEQAHQTIGLLFKVFRQNPDRLPAVHAERARQGAKQDGDAGSARVIADYIAGMTDRFALQTRAEFEKSS